MFVLVDVIKDRDGKRYFEILDTDDLAYEKFTIEYVRNLFIKIPDLVIDGVKYDKNTGRLSYQVNEYGNKYYRISDNIAVITKRRNGNTANIYYEIIVIKRGTDEPFWYKNTPKSHMDYLTFNFDELDDKYLVIDISAVDKHYYAEDREEYFGMYIILDVSKDSVKEVRVDKSFTQTDYLDWYKYENGVLTPKFSM